MHEPPPSIACETNPSRHLEPGAASTYTLVPIAAAAGMGSGAPPLHPAPPSTEGREAANGGAGAERREVAISREVQSQPREMCISVELTKRNHALVLDPGLGLGLGLGLATNGVATSAYPNPNPNPNPNQVLDPGMDMRAEYLKYAAQPRPRP